MKETYKLIALFGKSGSGKDTVMRQVLNLDNTFHRVIQTTTRAPRDYETPEIDYHFITMQEFGEEICNGNMITANYYGNNAFYGMNIKDLRKDMVNIGCFSIAEIKSILDDDDIYITPLYLNCSDKIRLQRSLDRELEPNCHQICRRFLSEQEDYEDMDFYHLILDNENDSDLKVNIAKIIEMKDNMTS